MTLGHNIQNIRKEAGLSQESFAELFHVSRRTISNRENGKSYPDLQTLVRIRGRFDISLGILLKEDLAMGKTFRRTKRWWAARRISQPPDFEDTAKLSAAPGIPEGRMADIMETGEGLWRGFYAV